MAQITNRQLIVGLLQSESYVDDGGAAYEAMTHYNIACPYTGGDKRAHCFGKPDSFISRDNCYWCVNQDSSCFGQKTGCGCDKYERFNPKPDMSFKDALETLLMMPDGAYPDYWFKFGKTDEVSRPFYCISFKGNKQMFDYRDAMMRCFEELMKLKEEAGDFKEEDV